MLTTPNIKVPEDLLPGDILLYGSESDVFAIGIEVMSADDVDHIEVYKGQAELASNAAGAAGAGDGPSPLQHLSWASRNGIGVAKYPFRLEGLRYVYRPSGPDGVWTQFNAAAVDAWFADGIDGLPYGWDDIKANLEPNADGLATTDLRRCGGADCSHFAAALQEVGGRPQFNPAYPKNKIKPNDTKKSVAAQCLWNYRQTVSGLNAAGGPASIGKAEA